MNYRMLTPQLAHSTADHQEALLGAILNTIVVMRCLHFCFELRRNDERPELELPSTAIWLITQWNLLANINNGSLTQQTLQASRLLKSA